MQIDGSELVDLCEVLKDRLETLQEEILAAISMSTETLDAILALVKDSEESSGDIY